MQKYIISFVYKRGRLKRDEYLYTCVNVNKLVKGESIKDE